MRVPMSRGGGLAREGGVSSTEKICPRGLTQRNWSPGKPEGVCPGREHSGTPSETKAITEIEVSKRLKGSEREVTENEKGC